MNRHLTDEPTQPRIVQVFTVLGLVGGLWGLTLALVPPTGEFPLNDDWVYAQAVKDWMETGHYDGHLFSTAAFVGQAWWGRLFCELFGFSFLSLRWSTLVLWLAGAWATSLAALVLGAKNRNAALAGGLVIANPLMMNLGYTFMTDVPFVALMAISGLFYLRAIQHPAWQWIVLGSLFGAAALLTRQFAVLLPAAYVLASCPWEARWRQRATIPLLIAFALPWVAAIGLLKMLPSHAAEMGYAWNPSLLGDTMGERIFGAFKFYGVSMTYLGLFCLPLVLGAMVYWLRFKEGVWQRRAIGFALVMLPLAAAVCWSEPRRIPFLGNMIFDTGVGPMTLRGILMGSYLWRPVEIGGWWWIPTLLGLIAACWMIAGSLRWGVLIPGDGRRPLRDARRRQQCFLMIWAVLMVVSLYHPWVPIRFDRYLIGALVPVLLLVAIAPSGKSRLNGIIAWGSFGLLYAFSVLCLQDYMAWNTTRWAIANRLIKEQGVPPEHIDGGYEFNGWLTSPYYIERQGAGAFLNAGPMGWWVVEDRYAISWLPRAGFDKVEEVPYGSWLAGDKGKLWLLKKQDEDSAP